MSQGALYSLGALRVDYKSVHLVPSARKISLNNPEYIFSVKRLLTVISVLTIEVKPHSLLDNKSQFVVLFTLSVSSMSMGVECFIVQRIKSVIFTISFN